MRWKHILFAAATLAMCTRVAIADVVEIDGPQTQIVRYDDLDLTDSAGARILYARIEKAALHLCGPGRTQAAAEARIRYGTRYDCIRHAVANAVADVDAPTLTKTHSRCGRLVLADAFACPSNGT